MMTIFERLIRIFSGQDIQIEVDIWIPTTFDNCKKAHFLVIFVDKTVNT